MSCVAAFCSLLFSRITAMAYRIIGALKIKGHFLFHSTCVFNCVVAFWIVTLMLYE